MAWIGGVEFKRKRRCGVVVDEIKGVESQKR